MRKILCLVLLVCISGCYDTCRLNGANAYKAGVPATANPYVGADSTSANAWLEGYMQEKVKYEKQK